VLTEAKLETLAIGTARIAYRRWRGPGFPVVLAHGLTDSHACWTRVVERLAPHHDVVAYDARGHGDSSAPDVDAAPDTPARDLVALVEALELERPALVGHSMGAVTVAVAASLLAARCRAVVLEDPPLRGDAGNRAGRPVRYDGWEQWRARVERRRGLAPAALEVECRDELASWHPLDRAGWVQAQRAVAPIAFDAPHEMYADWDRHLSRVTCPLLLVTGEPERGCLIDARALDRLAGRWNSARVVAIRGAGHCVRRDRFDAYWAAVSEFLQNCRAAGDRAPA
jgi:N-formylmaleamate deformylase